MKKLWALLLTVVMAAVFICPVWADEVTVLGSGDFGEDGDNLHWAVTSDGVLTISGTGYVEMFFSAYSAPWRACGNEVTRVVIEEGVRDVPFNALPVSMVTLELSSTADLWSSSSADEHPNLKEIILAEGNPLEVIDGALYQNSWFRVDGEYVPGKKLLVYPAAREAATVTFPEDLKGLNYSAFAYNKHLEEVVLPEGVTEIPSGAFAYSESLRRVVIPEGVTKIGMYAFQFAYALEQVNVPSTVTEMEQQVFFNCRSLKQVDIAEGLTAIPAQTFVRCDSLKVIALPSSVTQIGSRAFDMCKNLESVQLSDNLTTIGDSAFGECSSLKNIYFPATLTKLDSWAFAGCRALESVRVSRDNQKFSAVDGVLFNKDQTTLLLYPEARPNEIYVVPETVQALGTTAFYIPEKLKTLYIPTSVTLMQECSIWDEEYVWKDDYSGTKLIKTTLEDIYYAGSAEQWDAIDMRGIGLRGIEIHFNAEPPVVEPIDPPQFQPGDVTGDDKVNNRDAVRIMQYLAGWDVEFVEQVGDVNGDGKINNRDAVRLLQYLAGWDVEIY